jgi:hypothetical protein
MAPTPEYFFGRQDFDCPRLHPGLRGAAFSRRISDFAEPLVAISRFYRREIGRLVSYLATRWNV